MRFLAAIYRAFLHLGTAVVRWHLGSARSARGDRENR
jgi:hypothetical protein